MLQEDDILEVFLFVCFISVVMKQMYLEKLWKFQENLLRALITEHILCKLVSLSFFSLKAEFIKLSFCRKLLISVRFSNLFAQSGTKDPERFFNFLCFVTFPCCHFLLYGFLTFPCIHTLSPFNYLL